MTDRPDTPPESAVADAIWMAQAHVTQAQGLATGRMRLSVALGALDRAAAELERAAIACPVDPAHGSAPGQPGALELPFEPEATRPPAPTLPNPAQ